MSWSQSRYGALASRYNASWCDFVSVVLWRFCALFSPPRYNAVRFVVFVAPVVVCLAAFLCAAVQEASPRHATTALRGKRRTCRLVVYVSYTSSWG